MTAIAGAAVAVVVAVAWRLVRQRRIRLIEQMWAATEHVTIERHHSTWYRVSPFPLQAIGKQVVRYVSVVDQFGRRRRCWLLAGDFVIGLLDQRITKVVWE